MSEEITEEELDELLSLSFEEAFDRTGQEKTFDNLLALQGKLQARRVWNSKRANLKKDGPKKDAVIKKGNLLKNGEKVIKCANCGKEGHDKDSCRAPKKDIKDRPCHNCGKPGHIARECPEKAKPALSAEKDEQEPASEDEGAFVLTAEEPVTVATVWKLVKGRYARHNANAENVPDIEGGENRFKTFWAEDSSDEDEDDEGSPPSMAPSSDTDEEPQVIQKSKLQMQPYQEDLCGQCSESEDEDDGQLKLKRHRCCEGSECHDHQDPCEDDTWAQFLERYTGMHDVALGEGMTLHVEEGEVMNLEANHLNHLNPLENLNIFNIQRIMQDSKPAMPAMPDIMPAKGDATTTVTTTTVDGTTTVAAGRTVQVDANAACAGGPPVATTTTTTPDPCPANSQAKSPATGPPSEQ